MSLSSVEHSGTLPYPALLVFVPLNAANIRTYHESKMKSLLGIATALSLLVGEVSAHYIFQQISVGGTQYDVWEGIREHTNYNSPVTGELA